MGAKNSPSSLLPRKKNLGKVSNSTHKAEREKMKREHLNELFLKLANVLELREQNNGKASILCETIRVVKVMLDQINYLKKENASLLSESKYVTFEKNELQDETHALQIQIGELKSEIKERFVQTNLDLNEPPLESHEHPTDSLFHQAAILNHVFVFPSFPSIQVTTEPYFEMVYRN